MMNKQLKQGIGYSVFNLGRVRHIIATALPQTGDTLRAQTRQALSEIAGVIRAQTTQGTVVQQTVFMQGRKALDECRQCVRDFYGPDMPATTYVAQPLCERKLLAVEALGVCRSTGHVEVERHSEHLVVTRCNGTTWAHCAHVTANTAATSVYERSLSAFQQMRDILGQRGFDFSQVFRTWLYLGDIVGPERDTQRYKELNRARSDFYRDIRFLTDQVPPDVKHQVYPASTGIGTTCTEVSVNDSPQEALSKHPRHCPACADIVMSCIAASHQHKDLVLVPLENPGQTAAFDYGANYSPKSPKFARAMALVTPDYALTFISGTASITASESRFPGDVERQTQQTLDNMEALVTPDNFQRHSMPGHGGDLQDLALARVYVKRPADYAKTRAVVESRLGELPTIYAEADVCRPELLVEIEGIVVTGKRPG